MWWIRPGTATIPVIAAVFLSSCAGAVATDSYVVEHEPSKIEKIDGSDRVRVVLTEAAAERLDIRTTPVQRSAEGSVVPSAAVFVDPDGVWWVYTSPEPFVFVRHEVDLDREEGGRAFLSNGPPVGADVVTVGVAELSGVEDEIGH
jgi:hypothetical protein